MTRTESGLRRRGELRQIQRAIVQGWNVSPEQREKAIALINSTLNDPNATSRETERAIACLRAIMNHGESNGQ